MLVRISRDGEVTDSQNSLGEEDNKLTVALKNNAYFIFVEGEEIIGVIPVACGASKIFLAPQVAVDSFGARVAFFNVNGRPIRTEFFALVALRDSPQSRELPTAAEIYKVLFSAQAAQSKIVDDSSNANKIKERF